MSFLTTFAVTEQSVHKVFTALSGTCWGGPFLTADLHLFTNCLTIYKNELPRNPRKSRREKRAAQIFTKGDIKYTYYEKSGDERGASGTPRHKQTLGCLGLLLSCFSFANILCPRQKNKFFSRSDKSLLPQFVVNSLDSVFHKFSKIFFQNYLEFKKLFVSLPL